MKRLPKLEYYLSESGRFSSFPLHSLGYPLLAVSLAILLCLDLMRLGDREFNWAYVVGLLGVLAGLFCLFAVKGGRPRAAVGIFSILLIYVVVIILCAVPYLSHGYGLRESLFESASGITTTGMSMMDVTELNDVLLVWRSITGWLGGFMFITIFSLYMSEFGLQGRYMLEAGSAAVDSDLFKPRITKIAKRFGLVYVVSTFLLMLILLATGVEPRSSVCLAMSTVSTTGFMDFEGGLTVIPIAGRIAICLFLFLSIFNFVTTAIAFMRRSLRPFAEDNESLYMWSWIILVGVLAFIILSESSMQPTDTEGMVNYLTVVLSSISTAGFVVDNYTWPTSVVIVMSLACLLGGSIDSPTGGVKVARAAMGIKIMKKQVHNLSFPNEVSTIRIRNVSVGSNLAHSAMLTILMFVLVLIIGTFLLAMTGIELESSFTLAVSALTTTGPGLYSLGNLGEINDLAHVLCTMMMIIGRLEVILVVAVFTPDFWRSLLTGKFNFRKLRGGRHQVS